MYFTVHREGTQDDTNPLQGKEFRTAEEAATLIADMKRLTGLEYVAYPHEDRPLPPDVLVGPQPIVRQEAGPNKVVVGHILNDPVKRVAKQYSITDETTMQAMQACYNEGADFVQNQVDAKAEAWRKELAGEEDEDDIDTVVVPKKVIPPNNKYKDKTKNHKKRGASQHPMAKRK